MLDETVWDCRWALKSFSSYFPMKTLTIFFYCISWEKSINTNSTISPQTSLNLCNSTNLVAHIINTLPELFQKVILQNTLWVLKQYGLNRMSQDASGCAEPLASQKTTMVFWVQTNTGNIFFPILPEGKLAINLFLASCITQARVICRLNNSLKCIHFKQPVWACAYTQPEAKNTKWKTI